MKEAHDVPELRDAFFAFLTDRLFSKAPLHVWKNLHMFVDLTLAWRPEKELLDRMVGKFQRERREHSLEQCDFGVLERALLVFCDSRSEENRKLVARLIEDFAARRAEIARLPLDRVMRLMTSLSRVPDPYGVRDSLVKLMWQLEKVCLRFVDAVSVAGLAGMLRTFSTMRWRAEELATAIATRISSSHSDLQQLVANEQGILRACARFGYGAQELFTAIAEGYVPHIAYQQPTARTDRLVNLLWSYAVVDYKGPQLKALYHLFTEVVQRPVGEWGARKLWQIHLWFSYAPQCSQFPPVHSAVEKLRPLLPVEVSPSRLQAAVQQLMVDHGLGPMFEFYDDALHTSIDLAVLAIQAETGLGVMVAVEVDGPTHWAVNVMDTAAPLGTTLFRRRALQWAGWEVAVIPYQQIDGLFRAPERYLRQLLPSLLVLPPDPMKLPVRGVGAYERFMGEAALSAAMRHHDAPFVHATARAHGKGADYDDDEAAADEVAEEGQVSVALPQSAPPLAPSEGKNPLQ
jgi:hypothetical protein